MTAPAMAMHVINSLVPAIADAFRDLKTSLEDNRDRRHALNIAYKVEWQVNTLEEVVRLNYDAVAPKTFDVEDTEWLAVAIRSADTVSYNLTPRALRFPAPQPGESWEALRQPVPYVAFIKNGSKNLLCYVETLPDRVRVTKLITKESVNVEPGTRLKWLGENMRARLKSGVYTYVVVFVSDRVTL